MLGAACAAGGGSPVASATAAPLCGNGVAEGSEECDDGNASNADACLATCQRPVTWVTSDVHVHSGGCGQDASPARVAELLKAQQIQLGAALVWGEGYANDAAFFTGRDHPLSSPGFILHYDLEVSHFQAARGGHLLLLGLDSIAFSSDVFHAPNSGIPVVEWARRQPRAVVGMAHAQFWPADGIQTRPGGCCTPWDAIVHAVRGRLDFLSMERMPEEEPATFRLWKALENAGFRVAITGGSDWSCIADRFHERTPRTDVIVEGPLTYESWLAGIKAGRTVASARVGTRLNLRVNGHRIGDELQLAAAQDVTVTLETAGVAADVEVLVNGEPRARVSLAGGPAARAGQAAGGPELVDRRAQPQRAHEPGLRHRRWRAGARLRGRRLLPLALAREGRGARDDPDPEPLRVRAGGARRLPRSRRRAAAPLRRERGRRVPVSGWR